MNAETTKAALSLLETGKDFALATILDSQGSSPRHVGTSMLVRTDGSIAGTIGGGPLEAAVINNSLEVLAAGRTRLMDFDSRQLGMMCGGGGLVLVEYVDSDEPAAKDLYRGLLDLLERGDRGWLVTVVRQEDDGEPASGKCLVRSDGSVAGHPVRPPESLQELAKRGGTYDQILAGGDPSQVYVQPVGARGKAYVFGAGHCGEKLVPVLSTIGFFTVIVDDRGDFANQARFPMADRIVVPESFDGVVATLPIDEESYIVIVTRGHAQDRNVLEQALRTAAGYVGMMGSRKKVAEIFQALQEEGFTPEDISRVHAPIGIVIGAETPEEIAISIAAELVQSRARLRTQSGAQLRAQSGA
jgi:xanthine dehydrogenase accessory factor